MPKATAFGLQAAAPSGLHHDPAGLPFAGLGQTRQDGNGNLGMEIVVEKIEGKRGRNIGRGDGLAPTLERRYGLNPAAGSY